MVNLLACYQHLLHKLMKSVAGLKLGTIEIDPGTVLNMWTPSTTMKGGKDKPAVVLLHGFAANGLLTWHLQVAGLVRKYSVYVPDLLFFEDSVTAASGGTSRSPSFQAQILVNALHKVGVRTCTAVGFSYGGMVAFQMAQMHPDLVVALVVSGSCLALTDSMRDAMVQKLGFSSLSDMLMPNDIKGLRDLYSAAFYKKNWPARLPNKLYQDYLQVMFKHRKEKGELLDGMVVTSADVSIPHFPQPILLLWGKDDQIFDLEHATRMKEQLGENVKLLCIKKAGHLVHLERPQVYNRYLKEFLSLTIANYDPKTKTEE